MEMRTFSALLGILSTLFSFSAGFTFNIPQNGYQFTPGQPTTLNWQPASNIKITLQLQPTDPTQPIYTITNDSLNIGAYTWTVPNDIPPYPNYYVIAIIDNQNPSDYATTPSFAIPGSTSQPQSSSSSSSTSTTLAPSTTTTTTSTTQMTTTTTVPMSTLSTEPSNSVSLTQIAVVSNVPSIPSSSIVPSPPSLATAETGAHPLSTTDKTVIIVVVLVGSFVILAIVYFVPLRRRRRRRAQENLERNLHQPAVNDTENKTKISDLWHLKPELAGSDPETGAKVALPVELPASEPVGHNNMPPVEPEGQVPGVYGERECEIHEISGAMQSQ